MSFRHDENYQKLGMKKLGLGLYINQLFYHFCCHFLLFIMVACIVKCWYFTLNSHRNLKGNKKKAVTIILLSEGFKDIIFLSGRDL